MRNLALLIGLSLALAGGSQAALSQVILGPSGNGSTPVAQPGASYGGYGYGNPTYGGAGGYAGYGYGTPVNMDPRSGALMQPGLARFPYYNQAGMGYYFASPYAAGCPAYPLPTPVGGGYFQFGSLGARCGYWRAPSGYYYPWCPQIYSSSVVYNGPSPIFTVQQGVSAPSRPPLSSVFSDMRQFLEDCQTKNKLSANDYQHLMQRLNDLMSKQADASARCGGTLDPLDEESIRRDLDLLSGEISRALVP